MLRKALLVTLPFALACALAVRGQDSEKQDPRIGIAGKVIDQNSHPVAHALVIIKDRDTNASVQVKTDNDGFYQAWHLPAQRCTVHVVPPLKTGLAQSMLAEVQASETRHVFVSVRKGFEIRGRLISKGKPMRNVTLTVKADDGDTLHGGGETSTDGKGQFALILTPGAKTFEFHDIESAGANRSFHQQYTVTADSTMSDVIVPNDVVSGSAR